MARPKQAYKAKLRRKGGRRYDPMTIIPPRALDTIPAAMKDRPRTVEGFPIPFVTIFEDIAGEKVPDFTRADMKQWDLCFTRSLCSMCGGPLESTSYFIGGPSGVKSLEWYDPPMHRACASYAMRACPFLALTFTTYSNEKQREAVGDGPTKPDHFFVVGVKTGEWAAVTLKSGARHYRVKNRRFVRSYKSYTPSRDVPPEPAPYVPIGVQPTEAFGAPGLVLGPPVT